MRRAWRAGCWAGEVLRGNFPSLWASVKLDLPSLLGCILCWAALRFSLPCSDRTGTLQGFWVPSPIIRQFPTAFPLSQLVCPGRSEALNHGLHEPRRRQNVQGQRSHKAEGPLHFLMTLSLEGAIVARRPDSLRRKVQAWRPRWGRPSRSKSPPLCSPRKACSANLE